MSRGPGARGRYGCPSFAPALTSREPPGQRLRLAQDRRPSGPYARSVAVESAYDARLILAMSAVFAVGVTASPLAAPCG